MMPRANVQPLTLKVPQFIQKVYDPSRIYGENILLGPEDGTAITSDKVRVRALDGFLFVKDNRFVYPRYQLSTPEWWEGVEAYGYIAALTGNFRWFIWAGHWDEEYDGRHLEVVRIDDIVGMVKESNKHWRAGEEEILWVESEAGYSYALLEPAEEYDLGNWVTVTNTWTLLPEGESQDDPSFTPIQRHDEKPSWWKGQGWKGAWNFFLKPIKDARRQVEREKVKTLKAEKREVAKRRKVIMKAFTAGSRLKPKAKAGAKGKGKGKEVVEDASEGADEDEYEDEDEDEDEDAAMGKVTGEEEGKAGSSAGTKRKRAKERSSRTSLRPRSTRPSYIEIDSSDKDAEGEDEDADEEAAEAPQFKRVRESPRQKLHKNKKIVVASPKRSKGGKAEEEVKEPTQPGTALDTGSQSKAAHGESEADHPGASQPTRAMRGLTIGELTDQPMADAAGASGSENTTILADPASKASAPGSLPPPATSSADPGDISVPPQTPPAFAPDLSAIPSALGADALASTLPMPPPPQLLPPPSLLPPPPQPPSEPHAAAAAAAAAAIGAAAAAAAAAAAVAAATVPAAITPAAATIGARAYNRFHPCADLPSACQSSSCAWRLHHPNGCF